MSVRGTAQRPVGAPVAEKASETPYPAHEHIAIFHRSGIPRPVLFCPAVVCDASAAAAARSEMGHPVPGRVDSKSLLVLSA